MLALPHTALPWKVSRAPLTAPPPQRNPHPQLPWRGDACTQTRLEVPSTASHLTHWPKIIAGGASVRSWAHWWEGRIRSAPYLMPLYAGWLEHKVCKAEMSVHTMDTLPPSLSASPHQSPVSWSHSFSPRPLEGAIQITPTDQIWILPSLKPFVGTPSG